MNTKKLFSSLVRTGTRLAILASMLMTAFMGGVTGVAAAPPLALVSLSVGAQSGTITAGIAAGGSAAYTVTVTRSLGTPDTPTMSITGLPAGATGSFGIPSAWIPASGTGTRTYPLTITASCVAAGSYNFTVQASAIGFDPTGGGTLAVDPAPAPGTVSLYFSTNGNTNPPCATGTPDDADIYGWDGVSSSRVIDVTGITNPLPGGANVDGFVRVDNTHFYMSFTGGETVPVIGAVADEDIVYYNAGTWSLAFDGSAFGLTTADFDLDAFSIVGGTISANNLYFSTDNTNIPTGAGGTGDDADIYRWNGGSSYTRVVDASAVGVPFTGIGGGSNVDGIYFDTATHFYMSFSNGTTALTGPGNVQDEDIVEYNAGTWSVYFDGTTAAGLGGNGDLDIDAFSLILKSAGSVTISNLPASGIVGGSFTATYTALGDGATSVTSSTLSVCTVSGNLVSYIAVGTCTLTAHVAEGTNHLAANGAPQSFTISAASSGSSFDLYAVTGSTTLPGSVTATVWGYNTTNAPVTQPGGPVLIVNQGDAVTVTLHNQLAESTALLFQGQSMIPDTTGAGAGGTKTYTFTASQPGTFLYEAGLIPGSQHQVAMGLYGALIVRPTGAPLQAYGSAATAFNTEQVLVLSELDTALNGSANPAAFDMRTYSPKYYLINGKAYPNTDPISVTSGNKVLLRYVNAGLQAHAMSTLGLSQSIIGQDGNAFTNSHTVVSETIAPGQTLDTIVSIPAAAVGGTQYPLYDASLYLRNNTGNGSFAGMGGMLAFLTAGAGTPPPPVDAGPSASLLGLAPNPTNGSVAVTVTATITDVAPLATNIAQAEFYIDTTAGSANAMTAVDASFNSLSEAVTGTIPGGPLSTLDILASGNHTIYVRGRDTAGNWGAFQSITLNLDKTGPATSGLQLSGFNLSATGDDTASGNSNVTAAEYWVDAGSPVAMTIVAGSPAPIRDFTAAIPPAGLIGPHVVSVRSQDSFGNWGAPSTINLNAADALAPTTSNVSASPNPNNGSQPFNTSILAVRVTADFSDVLTGNSNVVAAEGFLDVAGVTGTGFVFIANDGLFNSPAESGYVDIPLAVVNALSNGPHPICVHAKDASGNWGVVDCSYIFYKGSPLYFSTAGNIAVPTVGGTPDDADIYFHNGSAFSRVIDVSAAPYSLPGGANVDGFDRVNATQFYMSFNGSVAVPGLGTVAGEDVVFFNGTVWSLYFDGSVNGLTSNLDAISIVGGNLYFSLSTNTTPPGVSGPGGDDADIYRWNGGSSYTRIFDATAQGWSGNNVDGFVYVDADTFYLSYSDTSSTVSGLGTVQDEDVVKYDAGTWSMYFDGTNLVLTDPGQDIDAFDIP